MPFMSAVKLSKPQRAAAPSFSVNKQSEFMRTVRDMQAVSAKNGNSEMSLKEINEEIANARN